jgi:glycosyltransferase involved in cell wall biosynthesis
VLDVLVSSGIFDEIVVVDDGSTDGTAAVAAKNPGVRVVCHDTNQGKGKAMDTGVRATTAPFVYFSDADISGFGGGEIAKVVSPVLDGKVDMMIAMQNRVIFSSPLVLKLIPLLGGQRALTRELWLKVPDVHKTGFGIETALNFYASHWGGGLAYEVFPTLKQTIKERKSGLAQGMWNRFRMCVEVARAVVVLQRSDLPDRVKAARRNLLQAVVGACGLATSLVLMAAAFQASACSSIGPILLNEPACVDTSSSLVPAFALAAWSIYRLISCFRHDAGFRICGRRRTRIEFS